jgi:hypothetical protein
MNELQRSDSTPDTRTDGTSGTATAGQFDKHTGEKDPDTWVGLVWRIVRDAIESTAKLIRVCVLICLVGGALWLIASVVGK